MEKLTNIDRYSPIILRDHYKQKIFTDQTGWFLAKYRPSATFPPMFQKGWCQYPPVPDLVYAYFRLLALGSEIVEQMLKSTQPNDTKSVIDHRPLLCWLMENDFHRVILPIAVTAWLTVDEFRWHHYFEDIPEDLHYGLATQYPEVIIYYAAFIAGFNRAEAFATLSPQTIAFCEKITIQEIFQQLGIRYRPIYNLTVT